MGTAGYARIDALMEFPGTGDLSLTRAIVRYQPEQCVDGSSPRADDLGLALVVDGDYVAAVEAVELGSGRLLHLDLSTTVAILDWVYPSTLDYVRLLLRIPHEEDFAAPGEAVPGTLRGYCETIALGVLGRLDFGPLTRSTILRLGFRDILRDLDPHEDPVVRIQAGPNDRIEAWLDCDANALLVRRRGSSDVEQARLLASLFPGAHVRAIPTETRSGHQLRFPLPTTLDDARAQLRELRDGLLGLLASYEPERHRAIRHGLDIFGPRDTLAQLDRDAFAAADAYLPSPPAVVA